MNIYVRAGTIDDAERLALLHKQCFERHWDAAAFGKLLIEPVNFAWLAGNSETAFSSFVLARVAAGEAEILTLGTAKLARRNGLARALVHAAAAEAHARGATEIFLEVAAENSPALTLYGSLGFAQAGRRAAYYRGLDGTSADALTLRAGLPLSL